MKKYNRKVIIVITIITLTGLFCFFEIFSCLRGLEKEIKRAEVAEVCKDLKHGLDEFVEKKGYKVEYSEITASASKDKFYIEYTIYNENDEEKFNIRFNDNEAQIYITQSIYYGEDLLPNGSSMESYLKKSRMELKKEKGFFKNKNEIIIK